MPSGGLVDRQERRVNLEPRFGFQTTSHFGGAVGTQKHSTQRNSNFPKKSGTRSQHAGDRCPPVHTSGAMFSDGACIELIREAGTGRLCLMLCNGENRRIVSEVEFRGRLYRPANINPSILLAMTLPSKCGQFESTAELFMAARELLMSRGFPEEVALASTYFVFPTWFPEFLPIAPCLSIAGPRPEAALLLQLLGCLVRHPLPLGEVTRDGFCSLPMDLQPTLLIDQERISRSAWGMLSASNRRRAYVPRKGGLVNVFCSKAVYCGDALDGDNFGDGALRINLPPSRGKMPILDEKDETEISGEFQAKMLAYRSRNNVEVRESRFDLPGFTSGIRLLGRVLGASIVNAPELRAGLCSLLREYEEETRASRWFDLRCVTIEAALHHCHTEPGIKVHVGDIAKTVNAILKGRGDTTHLEANEIGAVLKRLRLFAKRDSRGYAIRLDDTVCRYIHQLAYRFEVATAQEGVAMCSHCAEISAAGDTGRLR